MLRTFEGKQVFSEGKNIRFVTTLDVIKCLEQIKQQRLFRTWEFISELPSNMSTMYIAHKICKIWVSKSIYWDEKKLKELE